MKHFGKGDPTPETAPGLYRKTTTVRMWPMDEPFICTNREGENMQGVAGDFLVEDGYGGYYPCGGEFHAKNYESVNQEKRSD